MKRMFRWLVAGTLTLTAFGCGSGLQRRLAVEQVSAVRRYGWTGMDLTLRVRNDSRRPLSLGSGRLTLCYRGTEIGRMTQRGEAVAAARTVSEVPMRWRIDLPDPASGYLIEKKFGTGETDAFAVAFAGRVCSGSRCRDISLPMMPLSEFLAIFGMSITDLQNRFDP